MELTTRWITVGAGLSVGLASGIALRRTRKRVRPLEAVAFVDVERYQGRWFEIARYPTPFERECAKNVTATYTKRGNRIRVVNASTTDEGRLRIIEGWARVRDARTNAQPRVGFFGPFGRGDYWIVDLADDYSYAVVGEPKRRFLWILARTPALDERVFASICDRLPSLGYDPARLRRTLQD